MQLYIWNNVENGAAYNNYVFYVCTLQDNYMGKAYRQMDQKRKCKIWNRNCHSLMKLNDAFVKILFIAATYFQLQMHCCLDPIFRKPVLLFKMLYIWSSLSIKKNWDQFHFKWALHAPPHQSEVTLVTRSGHSLVQLLLTGHGALLPRREHVGTLSSEGACSRGRRVGKEYKIQILRVVSTVKTEQDAEQDVWACGQGMKRRRPLSSQGQPLCP